MKISVKVVPGASRSEIVGWLGEDLKVRIQAPANDGKANDALCEFLASEFGLPARSVRSPPVLSAVEGIGIAAPGAVAYAVPATAVILAVLFLAQRFGTRAVASLFSPIMVLWFAALLAIGVVNVLQSPGVLRAWSPLYALQFFDRHGGQGWAALGTVVLCVTGAEALYADVGHFSAAAVRLSFGALVYPALVVAYCGQAAALVVDPSIVRSVFYLSTPSALFYPMLVLATLAAIIASQALITASYSLVAQAVRVQCFPRVTVVHTDPCHAGRLYIPGSVTPS